MPNISNNRDNTVEARFPTAYSIDEILLTNFAGQTWDIQALVTDFSITESIYTPCLTLSMNIKDVVNLMSAARITGHETITVKLSRKPFGTEIAVSVNHVFYVTEYPVYAKYSNSVQVYSLKGISRHAYLSNLKRVSRAYSGSVKDFITAMFLEIGNTPVENRKYTEPLYVSSKVATNMSFIVPNLNPLDAIYWVLRRAYGDNGSPTYLYQTLLGSEIRCETQAEIMAKPHYNNAEYIQAKFFKTAKQETDDYKQRALHILEIASDLKMSKFLAASAGAYASRTEYLDLSTKTLMRDTFAYSAQGKAPVLAENFRIERNGDALSKYKDAVVNYIPLNCKAFSSEKAGNYNSSTAAGAINQSISNIENLDSLQHDITLSGDFGLSAGIVLKLKLAPSVDPQVKVINADSWNSKERDEFLSGNYAVTAVVHKFSSNYICEVRVKRDTYNLPEFTT